MNDPKGKSYLSGGRIFQGNSRTQKRIANNLGVIGFDNDINRVVRSKDLYKVEQYLDSTQYDKLAPWKENCQKDEYTEIRKRKPSIIFPFAKIYQNRVASKLVGASTFPKFKIEEDDDTSFFMGLVQKGTFFEAKMLDVAKLLISYTSAFARFHVVNGQMKITAYNSNYCYPEFDDAGNLTEVEIKYIYETNDIDEKGKPICKWYKLELGQMSDVLYDNPEYEEGQEPIFQVVSQVDHNLGFVQGEWFRVGDTTWNIDGNDDPMACQLSGFIDAINYNLSQMDSSVSYGLDPQLVLSGMDADEIDGLIKSATKAWTLGRDGNAQFLEVTGSGVQRAAEFEDRLMKKAQDAARIVFLDPEKMTSVGQSGKAMEVLHSPLVELINEIRPYMEKGMIALMQKMILTLSILNEQGAQLAFSMPPGYMPGSLDIVASWPPVFELTTQDKQQIVSLGIQVSNANIVSRDTIGKWLQSQGVDFGVEDWELERQKVDTQKTFGGFF